MLSAVEWRHGIVTVLGELADQNFQERVWRDGLGPEVSSWEEAMNRLYDDYLFDRVVSGIPDLGFTVEQLQLLSQLHHDLKYFGSTVGQIPSPTDVLNSPDWRRIRILAKDVLRVIEAE